MMSAAKKMKANGVRVRFAPSPTGKMHLGTARAALFNWLYARQHGGAFILRMEDTDRARSEKAYEESILEGLKWLGLHWDELYRQSERTARYVLHLKSLLASGKAYRCFCSPDELEAEKEAQVAAGFPPVYSGKCRGIAKDESEGRAKRERSVIRLHMPDKKVSFEDLIRGEVVFDLALIGDIVIAKGLEEPLYNFAVVVDDEEMKITHVIRGEDHISNTPKQIAVAEALGFSVPRAFAHLPLILGPDRKKLSKRDLAKSILDYRDEGYLPSALLNFLVLLGWHPKGDKETLSVDEMVREFSFDRVQKSGAVMDAEKLEWMNGHYLRALPEGDFRALLATRLPREWLAEEEKFERVLRLERERLKGVASLKEEISFFFETPEYDVKMLAWKDSPLKSARAVLKKAYAILAKVRESDFKKEGVALALAPLAAEYGKGELYWPLRVALSGRKASPGPFECAEALGKAETLRRITIAIEKLS